MTAVSSQQTPPSPRHYARHAASSSTSASASASATAPKSPLHRQQFAPSHPSLPTDRPVAARGNPGDMTLKSEPNTALASTAAFAAKSSNGETSRFRTLPNGSPDFDSPSDTSDRRPSQLNARRNGSATAETKDDLHHDKPRRPVKPALQRSKSEYAPRQIDDAPSVEEEIPEWGARHGFEDHYQSEHIISQLANVGLLEPEPIS